MHEQLALRIDSGLAAAFATVLISAGAAAQCSVSAVPGEPLPGPATGTVHASIAWDPDGNGPQPARLVIGGDFTMPSARADHIASFDFATGTWEPLGDGVAGTVYALAVLPGGDLVAAGDFIAAGGTPALGIARWDGSSWHAFGSGLAGRGLAITVLPNGDLAVGGALFGAGQPHLWRWNGTTWSPLGGLVDGTVASLALAPNGDLYAGGAFVFAGGVFVSRVARFDGTAWHPLASGIGGTAADIALLPSGDLVVGGQFLSASGVAVNRIARWDGTTWNPLAEGARTGITAMHVLPNGDLLAAGHFEPQGTVPFNLGRWDGAQWTPFGSGTTVFSFFLGRQAESIAALPGGELVVAGDFDACDRIVTGRVAHWNGTRWRALGNAPDNRVHAVTVDAEGDLHVAGTFQIAGGTWANSVVRVHGGVWTNPPGIIYASVFTPLADGRLAADGFGFSDRRTIGFWDGTAWTPAVPTVNYYIHAIVQEAAGGIVIAGGFNGGTGLSCCHRVARLAGPSWQAVGNQYHSNTVRALLALPNGDLIAGGDFLLVDATSVNHVSRFDGTTWVPMGNGLGTNYDDTVRCLARLPGGDIVAAGSFTIVGNPAMNHVARWDGTAWTALGSGIAGGFVATAVNALLVLPDGDLLVGGDFATAGGVAAPGLARWNGTVWSAFGPGLDGPVHALAMAPDGDVLVGGEFQRAGGVVGANLLRLRSSCAAAATKVGTGCTNALGLATLAPRDLPWLGSTYRATCDQVPTGAFAFAVRGLGAVAVPLSLLHPAGGPGCFQYASMDSVTWLFPAGSRVTSTIAVPALAALLGKQLLDQVVVATLDPSSAITDLSSSNALLLTAGTW
jgi:hypothetical protein